MLAEFLGDPGQIEVAQVEVRAELRRRLAFGVDQDVLRLPRLPALLVLEDFSRDDPGPLRQPILILQGSSPLFSRIDLSILLF